SNAPLASTASIGIGCTGHAPLSSRIATAPRVEVPLAPNRSAGRSSQSISSSNDDDHGLAIGSSVAIRHGLSAGPHSGPAAGAGHVRATTGGASGDAPGL